MCKALTQRLAGIWAERSGIAVIEILVVVGIIVALTAVIIPFFS